MLRPAKRKDATHTHSLDLICGSFFSYCLSSALATRPHGREDGRTEGPMHVPPPPPLPPTHTHTRRGDRRWTVDERVLQPPPVPPPVPPVPPLPPLPPPLITCLPRRCCGRMEEWKNGRKERRGGGKEGYCLTCPPAEESGRLAFFARVRCCAFTSVQ